MTVARGTPSPVPTPSSPGSGVGPAAQERISRHQHAGEVLRARSILVVACSLWLVLGTGLDLACHHAIGSGSLAFVLVVRFATTAFHVAMLAPLFRAPLPSPVVANALASSVFPVTSFALMLMATHMGGLASPYVTAVFVVIMGEAIALPAHWRRGVLLATLSTLVYPLGLLVATGFDDALRAQLSDRVAMVVFGVYASVLVAAGIVCVWGGHIMWSLRQSVFESRKLGRYRLIKRIGQGGMGEVWRAEDRALRRSVALKILSPEHGRKPSRVARFEREIQATASVVHPNVVRIHDWGVTDDGVWYYAMDLLEGVDLSTLVRKCGPLPPPLAVHLFVPAADGLAEAHRRGIVHRDLKPGNMFVIAPMQEPQRIELLDFGIARIGDEEDGLTQAGAVMGTPGYMAPEVQAGAPAGNASDVYGFAAALYYALSGKTPRDTKNAPVSAVNATIPATLDDVLVSALDAEPSRRPTAAEFCERLGAANLEWTGSFRTDINHSLAPTTADDDEESVDRPGRATYPCGRGRSHVTFPSGSASIYTGTPMEPLCLDDLDDAALDRLPFGVIRLGPTGAVERMNRAEAERSGIQRWRALGRDYFRDVAGPHADDLAAHVGALRPGARSTVFHTFRGFRHADDAVVDMSRCEAGRVYLCIHPTVADRVASRS